MSRFSDIATLVDVEIAIVDGEPVETQTEANVFCNVFQIGGKAWYKAKAAGLRADVEIEMRSCEYSGQQRVVFHENEYEIERVANKGEFTRLTLAKRLVNV